jgi:hypothetical protein
MKIQLTESDLVGLIKRIISETKNHILYEDMYGSVENVNLEELTF